MLPKAEIVQFLTIALVWLAPMVIARSIDITEKILEENTENMEALALTNLARQKPVSPYMPSQLTDLFNNAFAKHTMMRIKGLRKVFDHVRGKKSHPPNHHERRVIVGGICCNGKRQAEANQYVIDQQLLKRFLWRLEETRRCLLRQKLLREKQKILAKLEDQ